MALIRGAEFAQAMAELGFSFDVLAFPDLHLSFMEFKELALPVLALLRSQNFAAVFSFSPSEYTWVFDHPDHTRIGEATRFAAMATNVTHFQPELVAPQERPELYLRTTNKQLATHTVSLTHNASGRRDEYLVRNYPTQFQEENKEEWVEVFNSANPVSKKTGNYTEYYQRIR